MVVARDGCSKRCLSQGIGSRKEKGSRKELVVARNWWSQGRNCGRKEGIGGRKEGNGGRKEGIGGRNELVVARNWFSRGIGCREELVVARNW